MAVASAATSSSLVLVFVNNRFQDNGNGGSLFTPVQSWGFLDNACLFTRFLHQQACFNTIASTGVLLP